MLSRGTQSTRPRDYYDIYILAKLKSQDIDYSLLYQALLSTVTKRNSFFIFENYSRILSSIESSISLQNQWKSYQEEYAYAKSVKFEDAYYILSKLVKKVMQSKS
ncbi:nucleotidyl transferase AbiEii/AbiGii toxin family protein [Veillonella sp.]|uniref:nucleotidyl transferase AbiEii/AbiGii toxin family protein n=1 Tax=Veillonella sp. TaxID=1926307 RepID=UPI00344F5023